MESILTEVSRCSTISLYLSFDDKLALVVDSERPRNVKGLMFVECNLAFWDGHAVPVHDLCGLVLM